MISKAYRFHGRRSLEHVFRRGHLVKVGIFGLKYVPNPQSSTTRWAIVVSRKVAKRAITRNRIRRRLYELARLHRENIKQGHDVVIIVYDASIADMPATRLAEVFERALRLAHLII